MNKLFLYNPISISFHDKSDDKETISDDLLCVAIAKSIKEEKEITIDRRRHKCDGGSYFVCNKQIPKKEITDFYTNKEFIFNNKKTASKFLNKTKKNPIQTKYISFSPIINSDSQIILGISDPEKASRIIGIGAYTNNLEIDIIPAMSTCSSIYRPLIHKEKIHLNLIDYFDRFISAKNLYKSNELLISMHISMYQTLLKSYNTSSHGIKKPDLNIDFSY